MRILMIGWEFPPMKIGGVGEVTYHIIKELDSRGHEVILILPKADDAVLRYFYDSFRHARLITANMSFQKITGRPFGTYPDVPARFIVREGRIIKEIMGYTASDFEKVGLAYASFVRDLLREMRIDVDVIHAHDWLTVPAAIEAKRILGRPLVLHIHSTTYDRSGTTIRHYVGDPHVYRYFPDFYWECLGVALADRVVAVSERIKRLLVEYNGADPGKVVVIYNALPERLRALRKVVKHKFRKREKIVLYVGRMSLHKGPDWFLKYAKRVLEKVPNVLFVMVGKGEMLPQLVNLAAELGIAKHVVFTGFLSEAEKEALYDLADVFVLPSVSEPFGLTPFEALAHGVPVVLSKQSGVAEVLK
ncbi:TPA: glycosyltransferase family 1 protein, partial [Candidatus Micrarchaeota archaeon]|nr:glycosyltransferase family 1 protein [Candidatus Micrarchaeota archaeon]